MGPNLVVFLVLLGFMAASCAASYGIGKLRPARRVVDEIAADVHEAHRAVWPCWCWEDEDDEMAEVRAVREADDPARPDEDLHVGIAGGLAEARALPSAVQASADAQIDVPRSRAQAAGKPGSEPTTAHGPGRLPSQDTYRAELAKLAGPDPAPWLAALIAPDPPPEPGPPAEVAWLERLLYKGAISTAWCESVLNDHAEWRHAEEAAVDRAIARWVEESWWVLIGCRQWPHPDLVSAT